MRSDPVTLLSGGDASGTVTSNGVFLDQIYAFSIQVVATGTDAAGLVIVQASNDNVQPVPSGTDSAANVVNWATLTSAGSITVAGPGTLMLDVPQTGVRWVRTKFTKSGTSTGAITIKYNGKG